ncbi:MAG: hypothetical protein WBV55_13050 [Candidatus Sulfotelmatobacter sp.]
MLVIRHKWTSWDSGPLSYAQPTVLFDAMPRQPDGSTHITELSESALVQWMVKQARAKVFSELGMSHSALYRCEVLEPFYSHTEGDLDLVLWEGDAPQEAVAVECKRVKVKTLDSNSDNVNKLEDVTQGVRQANRLYDKFAFFQTYLMIMTAVDASRQDETNIPCRGISSTRSPDYGETGTLRKIVEFPEHDTLNPNIGIIFVEFVQPSEVSFERCGSLGFYVHRAAQPRMQLENVTNRLLTLIR